MCQAGGQQVQRPDLSQGTEAVPEKQSRHIKREGRARLEERPELAGGWPQPQTLQGASGQGKRGSMGAELVSGTGRKQRSHQRDLAWGGGSCSLQHLPVMPFNRDVLLFSRLVMSNSLQPQLQHARLSCSSLSPRVCSNSCPLSQWCHPTVSPSVTPFSSCLQFFPTSGYFPMSQLFASGGQSIGVSASTSVFPKNTQD